MGKNRVQPRQQQGVDLTTQAQYSGVVKVVVVAGMTTNAAINTAVNSAVSTTLDTVVWRAKSGQAF